MALGIENGIVCFSGTKVGSTAIYYCNECGYKTLLNSAESLIRSCEHNGQWNGSIPNCNCTSKSWPSCCSPIILFIPGVIGSNPELLYGVFGGVVVIIILTVIMCFTVAIIALIRAKAKLKVKLEQAGGSENRVYEEIHQMSPTNMDTTDNVAYASCQAFACKST